MLSQDDGPCVVYTFCPHSSSPFRSYLYEQKLATMLKNSGAKATFFGEQIARWSRLLVLTRSQLTATIVRTEQLSSRASSSPHRRLHLRPSRPTAGRLQGRACHWVRAAPFYLFSPALIHPQLPHLVARRHHHAEQVSTQERARAGRGRAKEDHRRQACPLPTGASAP